MSKLLDLVPRFMVKDELMARVVAAVSKPLDDWRTLVAQLPSYLDPAATPEEWLNALMGLVALPRDDGLAAAVKRALIATAFTTWINKGTELGIEAYLGAYAGVTVNVVRLNTTSFIAGVSRAGDVCGTVGGGSWSFQLQVPTASGLTENEVRAILAPVVAAYEQYTVVFT